MLELRVVPCEKIGSGFSRSRKAMATPHGAVTTGNAHILTTHGYGKRSPSGGGGVIVLCRATAVMTKTAMIRRAAAFDCPSESAMSSSSTCCRIQRLMISNSSRRRRQEALRSRQWDVGVGGEADAMGVEEDEDEPMGSFWERLQRAWRVLIGTQSEAQATRKRFSRVLVRDRGFTSSNLSRLYNVARGAIEEHVELEGDEDAEVTAVVGRLGELRLDFRVRRVKSVLMDEPFSLSVLPDIDPNMSVSGVEMWDDSSVSEASESREGGASTLDSALPHSESSVSISGDELWKSSNAPLDLKARLGNALDRPLRNFVVPDVEPNLVTSADQLWDDNRASETAELRVKGDDEPFPNAVLPDVEQSLSIGADQLWDDNMTQQDLEVDRGASILKSITSEGYVDDRVSKHVLANVEHSLSTSGDQVWQDNRASQDLHEYAGGPFTITSTTYDGEWYTFSFTNAKVEQRTGVANLDGDLGKQL